jgi:hypothetical protein
MENPPPVTMTGAPQQDRRWICDGAGVAFRARGDRAGAGRAWVYSRFEAAMGSRLEPAANRGEGRSRMDEAIVSLCDEPEDGLRRAKSE